MDEIRKALRDLSSSDRDASEQAIEMIAELLESIPDPEQQQDSPEAE